MQNALSQSDCNISRIKEGMKFVFLYADKHQIFLQVDTTNFCLRNISRKKRNDGVDFLHDDKDQRFLQVDSILFYGFGNI